MINSIILLEDICNKCSVVIEIMQYLNQYNFILLNFDFVYQYEKKFSF